MQGVPDFSANGDAFGGADELTHDCTDRFAVQCANQPANWAAFGLTDIRPHAHTHASTEQAADARADIHANVCADVDAIDGAYTGAIRHPDDEPDTRADASSVACMPHRPYLPSSHVRLGRRRLAGRNVHGRQLVVAAHISRA